MDAKELRAGNYLYDEGKIICFGENGTSLHYALGTGYNFDPIPLTEEILLKAGFENSSFAYFTHLMPKEITVIDLTVHFTGYDLKTLSERTIGFDDMEYPFPCKYLHQLQNLYFALTGEELNIEL
jgi:hypothetical protein